jgi:hypothetical protein
MSEDYEDTAGQALEVAQPPATSVDGALLPIIVSDETGRDRINPARMGETAIWLRAENYPLVVPIGQRMPTSWRPAQGVGAVSLTEISYLSAYSNVPFLCELREPSSRGGWEYQNAPIHHNLMFGAGPKPFKLARSFLIPAEQSVEVNVTNRGVALAGSVELIAQGRWIRGLDRGTILPSRQQQVVRAAHDARKSIPFWLTLDPTWITLAAGQTRAPVLMSMPTGLTLISGALLRWSQGPFAVDMYQYDGGDRLTYGGPIRSRLFGGDGPEPGLVPGANITKSTQRIIAYLDNLSGAQNTVFLTWHGVAVKT